MYCSHDMAIEECVAMSACNLAETVHNKRLQQSNNKMTCQCLKACGQHDPHLHANCELPRMVERWL